MVQLGLVVKGLSAPSAEDRSLPCHSFTLETGALLHIQGANGCGKTTLLKRVCQVLSYSGQVWWRGKQINIHSNPFYADLRFVGHELGLQPGLTVSEQLFLDGALLGNLHPRDIMQGMEVFPGLQGKHNEPTAQLSSGQAQQVALCRLLIRPAKLWVLDEPFSHLDDVVQRLLLQLIVQHRQSGGSVLITHHACLSARVDEVVVLDMRA